MDKTMKEKALEHWEQNLKLLEAMDWDAWINKYNTTERMTMIIRGHEGVPFIGGKACPFCQYYTEYCCDGDGSLCPLYEAGHEGRCCVEWRRVSYTLSASVSATKDEAISAVLGMIQRIKEVPEDGDDSI